MTKFILPYANAAGVLPRVKSVRLNNTDTISIQKSFSPN